MPAEERFAVSVQVRDEAFEEHDDWDSPQQEYENEQTYEFPRCDLRGDIPWHELVPWNNGAKIDEHGGVEDQFQNLGQMRLLSPVREPAVPAEADAGAECD